MNPLDVFASLVRASTRLFFTAPLRVIMPARHIAKRIAQRTERRHNRLVEYGKNIRLPFQRRAADKLPAAHAPSAKVAVQDRRHFLDGSVSNLAGHRHYKLFVPSAYRGQPLPMIVMLHGCTQDPDDFATGTGMNELAEQETFFVLYPAQADTANSKKCWNWFKPINQLRDNGEPSLIAAATLKAAEEYAVDRERIYIAGLSAGGSMAAIMAKTYPDLYAAVAIHSGTPYRSANSVLSALQAMKRGPAAPLGASRALLPESTPIPAIVFHGDLDNTVHPVNGEGIVSSHEQLVTAADQTLSDALDRITVEEPAAAGRLGYTVTRYADSSNRLVCEYWVVHGLGHAWSGGSAQGTYTEPQGPQATAQIVRFFMESGANRYA